MNIYVVPWKYLKVVGGRFGNLGMVRVGPDLGWFSPVSFSLFCFVRVALGSEKFSLWQFPCILAALSS